MEGTAMLRPATISRRGFLRALGITVCTVDFGARTTSLGMELIAEPVMDTRLRSQPRRMRIGGIEVSDVIWWALEGYEEEMYRLLDDAIVEGRA